MPPCPGTGDCELAPLARTPSNTLAHTDNHRLRAVMVTTSAFWPVRSASAAVGHCGAPRRSYADGRPAVPLQVRRLHNEVCGARPERLGVEYEIIAQWVAPIDAEVSAVESRATAVTFRNDCLSRLGINPAIFYHALHPITRRRDQLDAQRG